MTSKRWICALLLIVGCSGNQLLAGDGTEPLPETVFAGQAGWLAFDVSGVGGSPDAVLFGGGQEVGPVAGSIDIRTGIEVDEGNGTEDLTQSITLRPGKEYHYRNVGVSREAFEPGSEPVTITVQGNAEGSPVVVRCRHNFFAYIKGDNSQGTPHLEVYVGQPAPINCEVDGRLIGQSEVPFMVVGRLNSESTDARGEGSTFTFRSEYEGDLNVTLGSIGGVKPGSITLEAHNGDIRGLAWALALPEDGRTWDEDSSGEIHLKAWSDGSEGSEIVGQFIVSLDYGLDSISPGDIDFDGIPDLGDIDLGDIAPGDMDLGNIGFDGLGVIVNPMGTIVLDADTVTELPINTSISFEPAPLPGVRKADFVRYLSGSVLTTGVQIGDVRTTGGPARDGGIVEIKTGMSAEDTGTGSDAVTADRTLLAEHYDFEYVGASDSDQPVVLTVTQDVVIRCRYLFDACIRAAEGLTECPSVEVYAGLPIVPRDDVDPVPVLFGMPYIGAHFVDVDLTGSDVPDEGGIDNPFLPGVTTEGGHIDSSGGTFVFHTTAFGPLGAGHLTASAGLDLYSIDAPAANGGEIILLARKGDITVQSLDVSGGGGLLQGGDGGLIMMRGDNISVQDGVTATGAGMSGNGGQVYMEALNYSTGEAGRVYCSGGSDGSAINASGTAYGGDVTLIPNTLDPEEIAVWGTITGTVNVWFPPDLTELEYE